MREEEGKGAGSLDDAVSARKRGPAGWSDTIMFGREGRQSDRLPVKVATDRGTARAILLLLAWGILLGALWWAFWPKAEVHGKGYIDLTQRQNGQYYVHGYLNGSPAAFAVSTGLPITTMSRRMADKAGIPSCVATYGTDDGMTQACLAHISMIQIGDFVFQNLEVAVVEGLSADAQLGMDVLGQLNIEQREGAMRLSMP